MSFFDPGELRVDHNPQRTAREKRVFDMTRKATIIPLRKYDAVIYEPDEGRMFCLQVLAKVRNGGGEVVDLREFLKGKKDV